MEECIKTGTATYVDKSYGNTPQSSPSAKDEKLCFEHRYNQGMDSLRLAVKVLEVIQPLGIDPCLLRRIGRIIEGALE